MVRFHGLLKKRAARCATFSIISYFLQRTKNITITYRSRENRDFKRTITDRKQTVTAARPQCRSRNASRNGKIPSAHLSSRIPHLHHHVLVIDHDRLRLEVHPDRSDLSVASDAQPRAVGVWSAHARLGCAPSKALVMFYYPEYNDYQNDPMKKSDTTPVK